MSALSKYLRKKFEKTLSTTYAPSLIIVLIFKRLKFEAEHHFLLITSFMSLICSRWFFGTMNRFQAQSHLLAPGNNEGAFLIRCSEKDSVGFVLSGKTKVEETEVKEEGGKRTRGVWCLWV